MSYLYHSEVIGEGWDKLGFYRKGETLNVYVDESPTNPRDDYDHIAEFQQLNSDSIEIDSFDSYLREALCAADILTCDSRYGCVGGHYSWYNPNLRFIDNRDRMRNILNRHIRLWYPDIIWHGELHKNGYSQGDDVLVYAIVTKSAMVRAGFKESDITADRAEQIAKAEFDEYASWALGDCYWAELGSDQTSYDAMGGFIGGDFEDEVLPHIKESFGI